MVHKYAGISGSVDETDADPLDTAWRELEEETTLTKDSLRLFRKGKPFSFVDYSIGREWTVNPFAFILKSEPDGGRGEAGIKIDWEHEGYEWFDPDAVNDSENFEGVPRIFESLRRVWFNIDLGEAAGNTLDQGLTTLQNDHESGARQLASTALGTYIDVLRHIDTSDIERWWTNVRFAGWHLWKNGRESMGASILNTILSVLSIIESKISKSSSVGKCLFDDIVMSLEKYAQDRQTTSSRTGLSFQAFLEQHLSGDGPLGILTLSFSSTIVSAIIHVLKKAVRPIHIHVLESRPLFEGVRMAQAIASFASENKTMVDITLHTDASVAIAASIGIDIVLIGADLIDRTAAVSNKAGTLPTILTVRYTAPQAKIVALSEKEKVLPLSPPYQEENEPREVTQAWGELSTSLLQSPYCRVNIENVYFEWVPSDLINYYITEDGVTDSVGISRYAEEVANKADQYFTNL
ncbi:hypothetical protein FLONG3_8995 [Fusarium longipes]|uniref:Nudix hydrolase domain-containing protein n=1 Tax=Fusarium longipes TaxID=694270 RepID=A0A395S0P8_9HYPO|nr:hypothetical protein FLONG3_8995 [Fusarium longipes]